MRNSAIQAARSSGAPMQLRAQRFPWFVCSPGVVAAFLIAVPALAWNDTGHMTVAELAWRKLSSGKHTAITTLLRAHPHYALLLATNLPKSAPDTNEWIFLRAATWPDMVRPARPGAPPKPTFITDFHRGDWHFTNAAFVLPADAATVQPPAQGEGKLLQALAENQALVKDQTKPAPDRAVALCWILHLMGDLHQPLHCVAWFSSEFPHGDRGGNGVAIRPKSAAAVLHIYWDDVLGTGESPLFIEHLADTIADSPAHTTAKLKKDLQHATVPQWAQESIAASEAFVYLDGHLAHAVVPPDGISHLPDANVPALNTGYDTTAESIAARRVALAGRRLTKTLKSLF